MSYKVTVIDNKGKKKTRTVEAVNYYALSRALDKCEIQSFTVSPE